MDTTFYAFQSNIRYFLNQLLKNPIDCKINDFLSDRGFTKKKLINILLKRDVITRHEKIDDKDENSITYKVKYKVKRKNFERNLKRIYNKYFEKNEENKKEMDEATSCASSGAFVGPLNLEPIRKESKNIEGSIEKDSKKCIFITEKQYNSLKESLSSFNVGDYQYTVRFPVKKGDPSLTRPRGKITMQRLKGKKNVQKS
jgi:hypothetical protein